MFDSTHIKDFLKYVSISDMHNKIDEFRDSDFKNMSYKDISEAVTKVITFQTPNGNISILNRSIQTYPKGTKFYRVRKLSTDDRILPLKGMSKISDCWEPPENIVGLGRLNKKGESLLYTSPINPVIAIEELKIEDDELFSLIEYEATDDINVAMIGIKPLIEGLTEEEALKIRMIEDFLKHEFIRDVGKGTEYLYRISELITKDYFDLPPQCQDAWCYPSIASKIGVNVCFRKNKKHKLKFRGVQITSIKKENDNYAFKVRCIAISAEDKTNLSYHMIGSNIQKRVFPEIT